MSRLLVTGATGMLGSHVALAALEAGWRVRALVRNPVSAGWLAARGVELAPGDLLDAAGLGRAARDCDAVVHAAAAIGSGGDAERFVRGNVVGTENVLAAARQASARLVHVSSTAVVGAARYERPDPTDESVPLPELPGWDAYGRTKQAAERLVLAGSRSGAAWAAVVRPPMMYGRRDRQFVPRVGPVLRRGIVPLIHDGGTTLPLVHAGSVASGILQALACDGADGRIYHLTEDRPVTVRCLFEAAARGLGGRTRRVRLPRPVAGLGFLGVACGLVLAGRVDLARHLRGTYRTLTRDNPFSAARAREELGWRPEISPSDAIEDAFRWWAGRRCAGAAA